MNTSPSRSTTLSEEVDYLFIHDLETIQTIRPEDIAKVNTLVLPAHPWINERQFADFTYADFMRNTTGFKRFEVYEGRIEVLGSNPLRGCLVSKMFTAAVMQQSPGYCMRATEILSSSVSTRVAVTPNRSWIWPKNFVTSSRSHSIVLRAGTSTDLNLEMKHLSEIENMPEWYGNQYKSLTRKIEAAGGTYVHMSEIEGFDSLRRAG